jgi:hypothetical protein
LLQVVPSPKPDSNVEKRAMNSVQGSNVQPTEEMVAVMESQDLDSTPGSSLQPVSLVMTQESQLDSTDPVYASLMDCTTPVEVVLGKLTTAAW